jgi:hypothetical protein
VVVALFGAGASSAGEFAGGPDKVRLLVGGAWYLFDTEAALTVSGATVPNAGVTFEEFLGLPDSEWNLRIEGAWQFRPRHYFEFGWVDIDRSASVTAAADFDWGEYTFLTGAAIESRFRTDFPYGAYRYDFRQTEEVKVSGTFGVSALGVRAAIAGSGEVIGPGGTQSGTFEEEASLRVPVPLLGLHVETKLADRWALEVSARLFAVGLSNIEGSVGEISTRFRWNASRNVGMAVGVDRTSIDIRKYETKGYRLRFDYAVVGLGAYLTMSF